MMLQQQCGTDSMLLYSSSSETDSLRSQESSTRFNPQTSLACCLLRTAESWLSFFSVTAWTAVCTRSSH